MVWSQEAERLKSELEGTEKRIEEVKTELQTTTDSQRRKELENELKGLQRYSATIYGEYSFYRGRDARIQARKEQLEEQRQEKKSLGELKKSRPDLYLQELRSRASQGGSGSPQDISYLRERERQGLALSEYEPIEYEREYPEERYSYGETGVIAPRGTIIHQEFLSGIRTTRQPMLKSRKEPAGYSTSYVVNGEEITEEQFKERISKQFQKEFFRKQEELKSQPTEPSTYAYDLYPTQIGKESIYTPPPVAVYPFGLPKGKLEVVEPPSWFEKLSYKYIGTPLGGNVGGAVETDSSTVAVLTGAGIIGGSASFIAYAKKHPIETISSLALVAAPTALKGVGLTGLANAVRLGGSAYFATQTAEYIPYAYENIKLKGAYGFGETIGEVGSAAITYKLAEITPGIPAVMKGKIEAYKLSQKFKNQLITEQVKDVLLTSKEISPLVKVRTAESLFGESAIRVRKGKLAEISRLKVNLGEEQIININEIKPSNAYLFPTNIYQYTIIGKGQKLPVGKSFELARTTELMKPISRMETRKSTLLMTSSTEFNKMFQTGTTLDIGTKGYRVTFQKGGVFASASLKDISYKGMARQVTLSRADIQGIDISLSKELMTRPSYYKGKKLKSIPFFEEQKRLPLQTIDFEQMAFVQIGNKKLTFTQKLSTGKTIKTVEVINQPVQTTYKEKPFIIKEIKSRKSFSDILKPGEKEIKVGKQILILRTEQKVEPKVEPIFKSVVQQKPITEQIILKKTQRIKQQQPKYEQKYTPQTFTNIIQDSFGKELRTSLKPKSDIETALKFKPSEELRQKSLNVPMLFTPQKEKQKVDNILKIEQPITDIPEIITKTRQPQETPPITITSTNIFNQPPPPTIYKPFKEKPPTKKNELFNLIFEREFKKQKSKTDNMFNFYKRYRPTVYSVVTGFKSKPVRYETLSGLGLRPLVKF